MTGGDKWGPWAPSISHAELVARLRVLRAIVQLCQPNKLHPLIKALWLAESGDRDELEAAWLELERMPALTQRRVAGSWAEHWRFAAEVPEGRTAPPKLLEGAG
jgi:hypothetical protein